MKEKLELGWSSEQIAGRIRRDISGKSVSYETIYQYIFKKRLVFDTISCLWPEKPPKTDTKAGETSDDTEQDGN